MPEYVLQTRWRAIASRTTATSGSFEEGKEATENADDYVFITVFFAVGAVLRRDVAPVRVADAARRRARLGAVLLVYGFIELAS